MKTITRILLNFLILALQILFFRYIGWLTFQSPPLLIKEILFNNILIAGIIGMQMIIIAEILEFFYKAAKFATFGTAKLIYPIYFIIAGYLKLLIPRLYLINWYTHVLDFLPVLVMAISIGLLRIPHKKKK